MNKLTVLGVVFLGFGVVILLFGFVGFALTTGPADYMRKLFVDTLMSYGLVSALCFVAGFVTLIFGLKKG